MLDFKRTEIKKKYTILYDENQISFVRTSEFVYGKNRTETTAHDRCT